VTYRRTQAPRHLDQYGVSDIMAVLIVHFLKVIGIDQIKDQVARVQIVVVGVRTQGLADVRINRR